MRQTLRKLLNEVKEWKEGDFVKFDAGQRKLGGMKIGIIKVIKFLRGGNKVYEIATLDAKGNPQVWKIKDDKMLIKTSTAETKLIKANMKEGAERALRKVLMQYPLSLSIKGN